MKRIVFTVTNGLNYDQRMIRICSSLAGAGYDVLFVGRSGRQSVPLQKATYHQKRLFCFFSKGFGMYAEFNIRLFFFLLFCKADVLCCIDLDTILPVRLTGIIRNKRLVYDAHELFSEMNEIRRRPRIYNVWHWIEKTFLPQFKNGYTVSESIAAHFEENYGVQYEVIRNMPYLQEEPVALDKAEKILIYQGAVNEARGFDGLINAMLHIPLKLYIYGDGNYINEAKELVKTNNLQHQVFFMGMVLPAALDKITQQAWLGVNLVENTGLSQYYSLANKFFDYMQNGIPQLTMNYPEYKRINDHFEVACLLDDTESDMIVKSINALLADEKKYLQLQQNCLKARLEYNWQNEEKKLIAFYKRLCRP